MRATAAALGTVLWLVCGCATALAFEILNRQSAVLDCADRDLPPGMLDPDLTARVIEARPGWFPLGWHCEWLVSDGTTVVTHPDPSSGVVAYIALAAGTLFLVQAVCSPRRERN